MDLSSFKSKSKSQNLKPISKVIKLSQIHSDYKPLPQSQQLNQFSLSPRVLQSTISEKKYNRRIFNASELTEKPKRRKSYENEITSTEKIEDEKTQLGYSKKHPHFNYVPYSIQDYKNLGVPSYRAYIGAWRVGGNEWKKESAKIERIKLYSNSLKKLSKHH
jgi:hypothetical protein